MQITKLKIRRKILYPVSLVLAVSAIAHDHKIKSWCGLPYPGHPKGCPNYPSTKPKCPNMTPYVTGFFDLCEGLYLVYEQFNLKEHMARMKRLHPHWTVRQQKNVLYWQNGPKSRLKEKARSVMNLLSADAYCTMPESLGVQVYITTKRLGLRLAPIRKCPEQGVIFIALIGWRGKKHKYNF